MPTGSFILEGTKLSFYYDMSKLISLKI